MLTAPVSEPPVSLTFHPGFRALMSSNFHSLPFLPSFSFVSGSQSFHSLLSALFSLPVGVLSRVGSVSYLPTPEYYTGLNAFLSDSFPP